jgi:two-component system, NarL family, sensor histidine kinase UhpB
VTLQGYLVPGRIAGALEAGDLPGDAEVRYRALIEQLPSIVYLAELGEEGDWLYVSPQIERMLGYTQREWLEHPAPFATFTHPDDRARVHAEEYLRAQDGQDFRVEYRLRRKDGREVWVRDEAVLVHDEAGEPMFWQGLIYDITAQKRIESELRQAELQKALLLDRVVSAGEEERTRIASDLHDGPIQRLSAILYRLHLARRDSREGGPGLDQHLRHVEVELETQIQDLRQLLYSLRPPVLDQLGLRAALEHHARSVGDPSRISIDVAAEVECRMTPALETIIFRVAQEAITNACKHAAASRIGVQARCEADLLVVEVRDDGVGFPGDHGTPALDGHFGVAAMQHRLDLVGGHLDIASPNDGGTVVRATLPLPS